jgi:outer membrane protein, heavy metal efflux system
MLFADSSRIFRSLAGLILTAAMTHCLHAQQTLSLQDAIRIGLARNPAAQASADRIDLQRAQITQARLRPNPRAYLQSEDLRPWDSSSSFPNDTEDYGYVSQTIETAGRRGKRVAYAESGVAQSEDQHTLELHQLAAGIADAYWAAQAARAEAAEWKRQLANFDRIVQYQSDRVHSGATAGVDLLRTQIERDRVALSYAEAQRYAEAANIDLAMRIGSVTAKDANLTDPLEQEYPIEALPMASAVESRPDVAAARDALKQASDDLRLQHADAIPNLDFLGGYKRDVGANTAYAGLQFDLPIFNRNQGGIATARVSVQLAQDQLADTRLIAASEIETAVSDYHREQDLVHASLPGMDDRATRNAAIIEDAYRSGGADLLRYLDAERVLIETRLLAIHTWAEYQRAVVSLKLAYGEQP